MLGNFSYYNPTKLYFGDESLNFLKDELKGYGPVVLLNYGSGSVKRNGIYDQVVAILKEAGKTIVENPGVMTNPTLEKLNEGVKIARENKVDLILLDHEMPVTSGPQVLEMLRSEEETKHIPVMFLTGKGDKESVMAVVELRPEGYFLKNIKKEELLEKLKEFFVLHGV